MDFVELQEWFVTIIIMTLLMYYICHKWSSRRYEEMGNKIPAPDFITTLPFVGDVLFLFKFQNRGSVYSYFIYTCY